MGGAEACLLAATVRATPTVLLVGAGLLPLQIAALLQAATRPGAAAASLDLRRNDATAVPRSLAAAVLVKLDCRLDKYLE